MKNDISIDIYNLDLNDTKTWDLISSGRTVGVFQLEESLGQNWAAKLKPRELKHLAALIAILRPSCLRAMVGDPPKSITQRYCDRKNGLEEIKSEFPALEPILKDTYQLLLYQEEVMRIAVEIAGFSPNDSQTFLKGIAKKHPEILMQFKQQFVNGCEKVKKVTRQEGEEIFEWIKSGSRYGFNLCLHPDTLVETKNGNFISLREVSIGTEITSPFGYTKILKKYYNGEKELFKITTENGRQLSCTLYHKFLCENMNREFLYSILNNEYKIICDSFIKEKIITINKIGKLLTIDLEVDNEEHIYYANGIAVSNSHSISYSYNTFISAYFKANYPLEFFNSYIIGSGWKQDPQESRNEIVNDAKSFGITINVPNIQFLEREAHIKDKEIYLGLGDAKGVGESALNKLVSCVKELEGKYKCISEWTWEDWLFRCSDNISSSVHDALVLCGVLDCFKKSRHFMKFEYEQWNKLTKKEKQSVKDSGCGTLYTGIQFALENKGCIKKRAPILSSILSLLSNPPHELHDSPESIAWYESQYLGVSLTNHKTDCYALVSNCTCKEFIDGKDGHIILIGQIKQIKEINTKNKQKMAFIDVEDSTGLLQGIVCFPNLWQEFATLEKDEVIVCFGKRDRNRNSLILEKITRVS